MKASATTRKLTTMAMLTALSIVLVTFIHFPIFPAAVFLEYDPGDIPIFIGTFLFGPAAGIGVSLVVSVVQGTTVSSAAGIVGIIMNVLSTSSFALVAGNIYRRRRTQGGAVMALGAGVLTMTAVMVLCNLILTPLYTGTPVEAVVAMLLPVIIPFNLIKAGINGLVTYLVYKPIARVVHGEKAKIASGI